MKLFRRSSSNISPKDERHLQARQPSVTEPDRRSSFAAIPIRLRRRKTKTCTETQEHDTESSLRLGELVLSLPSEILTQIICYLSLADIYSIRCTSRAFSSILDNNSSVISRHMLTDVLPGHACLHAQKLYPIPLARYDMSHLLRMLHRQQKVDKVIYHTLSFVQIKIYVIDIQAFSPLATRTSRNRQRLEEALQVPAWTTYHFLESYRDIVLHEHDEEHKANSGRFWDCQACEAKAKTLVESYEADTVLAVYQFLQLLMLHYQTATRPPAHTSPLEWKGKAKRSNNEDLSIFTLLGGIEEMSKINMMQGSFPKRMDIISKFVTKVRTAADINSANEKSSRSSSVTNMHSGGTQHEAYKSRTLQQKAASDVTKSLCPSYSELTLDQLDRLPTLQDFLLPIWQDRVERENLHAKYPQDLESPFGWVQRIILQPDEDDDHNDNEDNATDSTVTSVYGNQTEVVNANANANANANQSQPQNQQQPHAPPPPPMANYTPTGLFASHMPTNLMPIFGAPPV